MKKIATLIALIGLVTTVSFGQSKTIERFQSKFEDDRDAKVVHINKGLFRLLSAVASFAEDDEDAQVVARIGDGINSMDILAVPYQRVGLSLSDFDDMRKDLQREDYEELMTVRDGDERVYIMTKGDENEVRDMVILVREHKDFIVMNMNGVIRMADLAWMAKHHDKWDN